MRVIAGSHRGRRLAAPASASTRPTSDKVREAIFDVLANLVELDGAAVLDLFAGSGAMGIEALSRGATRAVFVDDDRDALAVVRANLASLGLADRATVVRADAVSFVARPPVPSGDTEPALCDVAFCDPPYAFDAWEELLGALEARWAVLESSRPVTPGPGWEVVREKRYGDTLVAVVRRAHRNTD